MAWSLLLLLFLSASGTLGFDYYQELDVSRDASPADIKAAFRKLSLKYHPDKNKGDQEAQARFMRINEAYDNLSDQDKRQIYDLHGEEGLKKQNNPQAQSWDPFGLFNNQAAGTRKGPDFRMDFQVTLEELYLGNSKTFSIKRKVLCKKCRGTGAKGGETKACPVCRGSGVVTTIQQLGPGFNIQMQKPCDRCGGKGKTHSQNCEVCHGNKVVDETKELTAVIEKGMPDGHEIVFERMSEQSPETTPGNVILKLTTLPHDRFHRRGSDLLHTMTISLKEALLGFRKTIRQLDGRDLDIIRRDITPPGYVMVVIGEGMPLHNFPSTRGNLEITFVVAFPHRLDIKYKNELQQILSDVTFVPYVAPPPAAASTPQQQQPASQHNYFDDDEL